MNTSTSHARITDKQASTANVTSLFATFLLLFALPAAALPPNVEVTNVQPVDAPAIPNIQPVHPPAIPEVAYEPGHSSAFVYSEPVAYPALPGAGHRANVDLHLRNDETQYIRLDQFNANIGAWSAELTGDELLALPEALISVPLGPAEHQRPILTNGGFGVSGLKIEHHVISEPLSSETHLTFGEATDVLSFALDDDKKGYLVAGSLQFLLGDVPQSADDTPPSAGQQGFVAKYDTAGFMLKGIPLPQDEASALTDLGDGRYLVAGRYRAGDGKSSWLMVSRIRSWEFDEDGKSVDLDALSLDMRFGADDEANATFVPFYDGGQRCEVQRAVGATVLDGGNFYAIAAELSCVTGRRAGVAILLSDGALLQSFGSGGSVVFSGPSGADIIPVGIEWRKLGWVWLGGAIGDACDEAGGSCDFGLASFAYLTGNLDNAGWYVPTAPTIASTVRPRDMALDTLSRPVMAGVARRANGDRITAVHRFSATGNTDAGFGTQGWALNDLLGHDADAYAVRPRSNDEIALAVLSYEDGDNGVDLSMAMMNLSKAGVVVWEHSPYVSGDSFTHTDLREDFSYGYRYEAAVTSQPLALTEDWSERLVMVGFAGSDHLPNPCAQAAEELGNPMLDYGVSCGGPWSVALARYLPFGVPDSRRWIGPDEKRSIIVPSDTDLGFAPPSHMVLAAHFDGFTPLTIVRDMKPFANAIADAQTDSFGAYRFPFAPGVLEHGERFSVNAHPLDHHHRNAAGNRFAYDIGVVRWNGRDWVGTVSDANVAGNAKHLAFGRPVRAVAAGIVVACRRSAPDNQPGQIDSNDANFVKIKHTFNPFDGSRAEFLSYLHLKQDSIPRDVCPNICPADSPDCDPETEGVDPDGESLPEPVGVLAGEFIGHVGNSGHSTSPHLHIHMSTAAGPTAGSHPLLFHDVLLQSRDEGPGAVWFPADGQAIAHGSLAGPTK